MLTEGGLFYFKDGGGGGMGGGCYGREVISHSIKSKKCMSILGVQGSTNTNWRQFGEQVSDASSECPNTRVPMFGVQTVKNRDLAAPQLDLSVCADRKIAILYVQLRNFKKKTQFYRAATQIENFKMVFFRLRRKIVHAPSYAQLHSRLFSKEITALD